MLEIVRMADAILKVDAVRLQAPLMLKVARLEVSAGQRVGVVAPVVFVGRVEGRVRIERIDAEEPGLARLAIAVDELDRLLRAPMRLMQMGRHIVVLRRRLAETAEAGIQMRVAVVVGRSDAARPQDSVVVDALRLDPLHVLVAPFVAALVIMAVLEVVVAVIDALLAAQESAGQVQFADESAVVTGIMQRFGNQPILVMAREGLEAVAVDADRAGVHAGQEAGAAGRANRRLAVGMGEGRRLADETIKIGRIDVRIA